VNRSSIFSPAGGVGLVLNCVTPAGSTGCVGGNPGNSSQAPAWLIYLYQGLVGMAQLQLDQAKARLSHARSLQSTYQSLKSKADSLWNKWQKAENAATAADNALALAQGAYARAVANANTLTGEAQAAAAAATAAESNYETLKHLYDQQQQAKSKPRKHPGPQPEPCSTTCVKPSPRPHPIPLPAPGSGTPNPSPNPPGQSPPGESPSPSSGGAGQGSGSGGSGQPPVSSCSDDGGNIVYRNLGPQDDPTNGLTAKNPNANYSPSGHVINGSRPGWASQFISTTRSLAAALKWTDGRIVAINLDQFEGDVLDLSTPGGRALNGIRGVTAINRANASAEVLLVGFVPPGAISWLLGGTSC
jgi:hypothetical protein